MHSLSSLTGIEPPHQYITIKVAPYHPIIQPQHAFFKLFIDYRSLSMEFPYDSALDSKDRNEIRLLRLLPHKDPAAVTLTPEFVLETYIISKTPKYQALSYTWGPPEDRTKEYKSSEKEPIIINGHPFPVLPNLMDALCHIKQAWDSADQIQHLWIDAICINQRDPVECGQQVGIMSKIYQTASQVLVWLGRSSVESRTAFEFMRTRKGLSHLGYQQHMKNNSGLYIAGFHALCEVLNRRWFTRVWTLQEFAFASTFGGPLMICGEDRLEWDSFYSLGWMDNQFRENYLRETHSIPSAGHFRKAQEYWSIVSVMREIRINTPWGYNLPYLLQVTKSSAAEDPRDRVYALLGLAEKEYQQKLEVVYEGERKDMVKNCVEVYVRTVICCIEIDHSLNIVAPQASQKEIEDSPTWVPNLPSWVPDFSLTLPKHSSHLLPLDLETPKSKTILPEELWAQYTASGRSRPIYRFSANNRHLHIKGIRFGRICEVIGPFQSLDSYLQSAERCVSRAALGKLPRGHLHRVLHRYLRPLASMWRAFVADKDGDGQVPAPNWYEDVVKAMISGGDEPALSRAGTAKINSRQALVQRSLEAAISNRRFFRTDYGFVGIGTDNIENGDLVSIVFGADMPLVLRPFGTFHELVGAAYVHGVMRGEATSIYGPLRKLGLPIWTFHIH